MVRQLGFIVCLDRETKTRILQALQEKWSSGKPCHPFLPSRRDPFLQVLWPQTWGEWPKGATKPLAVRLSGKNGKPILTQFGQRADTIPVRWGGILEFSRTSTEASGKQNEPGMKPKSQAHGSLGLAHPKTWLCPQN